MSDGDRKPTLVESLKSFQDAVRQAGPAAAASYGLIGAIILLGGAGYGVDAWLHTAPWGVMTGLGLGIIVGFYQLVQASRRNP